MDSFDHWYRGKFGHLLESQDEKNKEILRGVWNEILEKVAEFFDFYDFEEYSGAAAAEAIRVLKSKGGDSDVESS